MVVVFLPWPISFSHSYRLFPSYLLSRWWPAEVNHPKNIPENILRMRHNVGEFPVHFFGSNDYLWTYQARVFPYMDVDTNNKEKMGKGVDAIYKKGIHTNFDWQ